MSPRISGTGLALIAATLLAGCAATDRAGFERGVSRVSMVEFERALDRPGGDARIYIQDGAVIRQQDRNRFEPYCSLGLRKRGDEALVDTVRPDRFLASEPSEWAQPASSPPGMRGLSVAVGWTIGNRDRGTPGMYTWATQYRLRSDDQPQVDRLTCAYDGDSLDGFLTLDRIRATLDGIATVHTFE